MIFKKLSLFTLCTVMLCLSLVSCGSAKIPEIANVEEMSAKSLLSSKGLIPAIVYEHSDNVAEDCVIRTEPAIGSSAEKNSVVTIYISKGPALRVPDVADVDEETAKKVLTANQLIPSIAYEYSDTIIEGNVTRTEPEIGSVVETNAKITVYLSYGPSYVEAKHVTVDSIKSAGMEGCKVYRDGDKLYIECTDFYCSYKQESSWDDPNDTGYIQGVASFTSDFYKTVQTTGKYQSKTWYYDRYQPGTQSFTLEILLSDLGVDRPSSIYIKLYYDTYDSAIFNLIISW